MEEKNTKKIRNTLITEEGNANNKYDVEAMTYAMMERLLHSLDINYIKSRED